MGFSRIVQRKDVVMLQSGCDLDLTQEAIGTQRGGKLGAEGLERDPAVMPEIPREIDDGHPTPAELALYHETTCQGETEAVGNFIHPAAPLSQRLDCLGLRPSQ
jgi:hypothetical protein